MKLLKATVHNMKDLETEKKFENKCILFPHIHFTGHDTKNKTTSHAIARLYHYASSQSMGAKDVTK